MTRTEKAIRDFCGHHADWWPSTTQVQAMLALAQPCPTCEALARTVMLDQTSHDNFRPDWDTQAVLVEEQQRMAKRIEELEAMLERQTARIVDLQTHIENFDGEVCLRCQGVFSLPLPMDVDELVKKTKAFIALHKDCKEQA